MSTTWRENYSLPRIFTGRRGRTGPRRSARLCRPCNPSSGQTDFRVMGRREEKRTLPGAPAGVFAFGDVAVENPHPGAGMLTGFPFGGAAPRECARSNGVSLSLRVGSPMSNCCSHGTFLHFSLQSSHLNICYYHQDLHRGPFDPGSPPRLRHRPPRLPTRRGVAPAPAAGYG